MVLKQALRGAGQSTSPVGQLQTLATQVAPVPQTLPQALQLFGSVVSSTQAPLQTT